MKNNDNLKEKEMDNKELESVSGGFHWGFTHIIYEDMCRYAGCSEPRCAQHCCHGAVKYDTCGLTVAEKWFKASIDQEACTGCFLCKSKENCPHGAIT